MSEWTNETDREFEALLSEVAAERRTAVPAGLEQRLLARFAQEQDAVVISSVRRAPVFSEVGATQRSPRAMWMAIGAHAVVMLIAVAALAAGRVTLAPKPVPQVVELNAPPPPVLTVRAESNGGGGGHPDVSPASAGRPPKFADKQILPPAQPPKITPQLVVEPTVVVPDVKMANNTMPDLGVPNSSLKGLSLGNGHGTGLGGGDGAGVGPGSGIGVGGGVYHPGGAVSAPVIVTMVDAEFSDEARKSKFSGNVQVYLIVDERGNPTHVRVTRSVGMGLDDKAIEAVRQYKFKPAMMNGKPVKSDVYVDVVFDIF